MKKNTSFIIICSVIILFVISACGGSAPAPQTDSISGEDEVAADTSTEVEEETEAIVEETSGESNAPIKIGVLTPTSSIAAQSAEDMMNGFNLFWEQHGLDVAGHPVEIFVEDTAGDPDQALAKARLLVEQARLIFCSEPFLQTLDTLSPTMWMTQTSHFWPLPAQTI